MGDVSRRLTDAWRQANESGDHSLAFLEGDHQESIENLESELSSMFVDAARKKKRPAKKLTVNERLTLELSKDQQRIEWSKRAWATHLKCSETAVHKSPQWRTILLLRERERRSRRDDRESA